MPPARAHPSSGASSRSKGSSSRGSTSSSTLSRTRSSSSASFWSSRTALIALGGGAIALLLAVAVVFLPQLLQPAAAPAKPLTAAEIEHHRRVIREALAESSKADELLRREQWREALAVLVRVVQQFASVQGGVFDEHVRRRVLSGDLRYLSAAKPSELAHTQRLVVLSLLLAYKQSCLTDRALCINSLELPAVLAAAETILDEDSTATFNAGLLRHWRGETERAIELYTECHAIRRRVGRDLEGIMQPLTNLELLYRSRSSVDPAVAKIVRELEAERWELWLQLNWHPMHGRTGCHQVNQLDAWKCLDVRGIFEYARHPERRQLGLEYAGVLKQPDPRNSINVQVLRLPRREQHSTSASAASASSSSIRVVHVGRESVHVVLRNATVFPSYSGDVPPIVYSPCRVWLCGQYWSYGQSDSIRVAAAPADAFQTPPQRLRQAAIVAFKHVANYFHFLIEGCSHLVLLLDHVIPHLRETNRLLPDFKVIIASRSQNGIPFSFQVLEIVVGVFPELTRMIEWYDHRVVYQVEQLHMVDWSDRIDAASLANATESDDMEQQQQYFANAYHYFNPPATVLKRLSEIILSGLGEETPAHRHIVYSSRAHSPRKDRIVLGEEAFLERLRSRVQQYNREHETALQGTDVVAVHVHTALQSVREQIRMFRSAKVVISPHGAGLSNILFCQPGTTVIELPSHDSQLRYFQYISMAMGLTHVVTPDVTALFYGAFNLTDTRVMDSLVDAVIERL